jgi:hypothetical protein
MDWPIKQIGPTAITFPHQREYARTAIQSCSLGASERHVYTYTGWRNLNGHEIFLHAGGAIGETGALPGVEVRLSGALNRYELQVLSATDIPGAVRASLRLAGLVSASISFPMLARNLSSGAGKRRLCPAFGRRDRRL